MSLFGDLLSKAKTAVTTEIQKDTTKIGNFFGEVKKEASKDISSAVTSAKTLFNVPKPMVFTVGENVPKEQLPVVQKVISKEPYKKQIAKKEMEFPVSLNIPEDQKKGVRDVMAKQVTQSPLTPYNISRERLFGSSQINTANRAIELEKQGYSEKTAYQKAQDERIMDITSGVIGGVAEQKIVQKASRAVLSEISSGIKESSLFKKIIGKVAEYKDDKVISELIKPFFNLKTEKEIANISKTLVDISDPENVKKILIPEIKNDLDLFSSKEKEAQSVVYDYINKAKEAAKLDKETVGQKVSSFFNRFKRDLVDFTSPIEDRLYRAEKESGLKILPEKDIRNQIDKVIRSINVAGDFIKNQGLEDVIKKVDDIDSFNQYLIAKHARTLESKGIKTGRDLTKDSSILETYANKFDPFAKQITEYSQKLLDYSADKGLISKELSNNLKQLYPDYVPMERVFKALNGGVDSFNKKAVASLGKQDIVKKIQGSEREIESPIVSLMAKTYDAFKQGEINDAARMLTSYEKLPGNPFGLREVTEKAPKKYGEEILNVFDNGVKKTFVADKDVIRAAKNLGKQQFNIITKILAMPVRIAKAGITGTNIPFVLANIPKDQLSAFINSKVALKASILNPKIFVKSLFNATKSALTHGKDYDEFIRQGAGGTSFDIYREQLPKTIEKIRAGRTLTGKILHTVKNPAEMLRSIEDVIGRSEEFTRLMQYTQTKEVMLKKGFTEERAMIEAAKAARENTVNFARHGEFGQVLNSVFLYLNAGIQGSRTLVRNLQQRPAQTISKIALSSLAPMAFITAYNLKDPKRKVVYDDIPDYEKQRNFIIIPPNPVKDKDGFWNVIKIPISQEVANLTNLTRKEIESLHGINKVVFKDFADSLLGTVSPIGGTPKDVLNTLTPQAIKPSLETAFNVNFYTGKDIVPDYLKNLNVEQQVYKNTSGTARKAGKLTGISPIKIEHLIKGYFGEVGLQVENMSDNILNTFGAIPEEQIGGRSIPEGMALRLMKARGGNTEQNIADSINTILKNQSSETYKNKLDAEGEWAVIKDLPKEELIEKLKEVYKEDEKKGDRIINIIKQEKLGITREDRLMKMMNVENSVRSDYIVSRINQMSDKKDKKEFMKSLVIKGVMTDEVFTQVLEKLKNKK